MLSINFRSPTQFYYKVNFLLFKRLFKNRVDSVTQNLKTLDDFSIFYLFREENSVLSMIGLWSDKMFEISPKNKKLRITVKRRLVNRSHFRSPFMRRFEQTIVEKGESGRKLTQNRPLSTISRCYSREVLKTSL